MKSLVALAIVVGLAVAAGAAQPPVLTYPDVPLPQSLDRLNLRLAWRVRIPVERLRDGIATIQPLGDVIVVQTRRGTVAALEPATGAVRWLTVVGIPYPVIHNVGYNDELILVDNGTRVHALDRSRGTQLWEVNLPSTPSSPPSADAHSFYVHLGIGRVAAYAFPGEPEPGAVPSGVPGAPTKAGMGQPAPASSTAPRTAASPSATSTGRTVRFSGAITSSSFPRTATVSGQVVASGTSGGRTATTGSDLSSGGRTATTASEINKQARGVDVANAPRLLWFYQTNLRVLERPVLGEKTLLLVSNDRKAVYLDKETGTNATNFVADSPFTAPAGLFGETAYLGSRDGGVYALDLPSRIVMWNFTANSMVINAAVATDEGVFVAADRGGLIRLDRVSGQLVWQNTDAQRFLAVNPKFVYALDPRGRLLVIDRARGTTLTTLETRDYVLPVVDKVADRLYLAAHDGTILCLHDKAYPQPVRLQNPVPATPPVGETPPTAPGR